MEEAKEQEILRRVACERGIRHPTNEEQPIPYMEDAEAQTDAAAELYISTNSSGCASGDDDNGKEREQGSIQYDEHESTQQTAGLEESGVPSRLGLPNEDEALVDSQVRVYTSGWSGQLYDSESGE